MELTLSPQIKIVALVGMLAALALGGGMLFLGRSQSSAGSAAPSTPLKHYHRVTTKTAATPTSKHASRHAVAAKPAAKPAVKTAKPVTKTVVKAAAPATTKPAVHSSPTPAVAANGLPMALDVLLHTHRIVVVSLYDPEAPADAIAFAEARAGAADASAGFLGVNVLDERTSAPLTALVGNGTVLPDPGILVFRRPGTLMNRITGFADRGAVAQLVAAALLADPPPAPTPALATTPAAPVP